MARLTLILGVLATVIYLLDGFRFMLNEWRNWRNKGKWLAVMGLCLMPSLAEAACGGSSPTWTSADASRTEVAACVAAASSGDTINVPAGSATWTSAVSWSGKVLIMKGAGMDVTTITSSGPNLFNIGTSGGALADAGSRVTGFTLKMPPGNSMINIDGYGWRLDHNKFQSTTAGALAWGVNAQLFTYADYPSGPALPPTGLVDHNTFMDSVALNFGVSANPNRVANLFFVDNSPLGLGDVNAMYIEDNIFTMGGEDDILDCNYGGRVVYRYNMATEGSGMNIHSNQGQRACRRWEIYENNLTSALWTFYAFEIRGATGVLFNNTTTPVGVGYSGWMLFQNVRSVSDSPDRSPIGQCSQGGSNPDGNNPADGNLITPPTDGSGWPCRDQIGWDGDIDAWQSSTPSSGNCPGVNCYGPTQLHVPAYVWGNYHNGVLKTGAIPVLGCSPFPAGCGTSPSGDGTPWIVQDRDYYNQAAAFDGTSGVGSGTLAARPATCTTYGDGTGVGYWATDQGEWNSTNGATPDGRLYTCTATNTWTLYYTPYTYPHPLNIDDPSTTIAPSPVVIARVLRWMEVAAFVTGMGWHFRKQVMAVSLAAIAGCGTLYQLAPRSYETVKTVSKDSAVKVLTVFNALTKPRS